VMDFGWWLVQGFLFVVSFGSVGGVFMAFCGVLSLVGGFVCMCDLCLVGA